MLSVLNLKLLSVLNFISITGPEEYIKKKYTNILFYISCCVKDTITPLFYTLTWVICFIFSFFFFFFILCNRFDLGSKPRNIFSFIFCVIGLTWVPNQEIKPSL